MLSKEDLASLRVEPGSKVRLDKLATGAKGVPAFADVPKGEVKEKAKALLDEHLHRLAAAQDLLWASDTYSLLVILQAMDAAGKDGAIKHVMRGVNPQGCQAYSFKRPSDEEVDHTFLWRCMARLPERGRIGIFNRSYYEEVLVVKVHPDFLDRQRLPEGKRGKGFWEDRYDDINRFERHLHRNGTVVVKLFLNVSKDEQRKRFIQRLEDPEKHWKFSAADVEERGHWDAYMGAYEEALSATSKTWAPWYVIPADSKWLARAAIAAILITTIEGLGLSYPKVGKEQRKALDAARKKLAREG